MPVPETINGLVLAGGRSTRMGSDKASLKQNGETQLDRAVGLLAKHTARVFVSTRADQADDPLRAQHTCLADRYENTGPAAGILTALEHDPKCAWLVLACDLPNVDDATLGFLVDNASAAHPATAFQSSSDDLPEPLCAIYRPAMRLVVAEFLANGIKCPRKMLIRSDTCLLRQPRRDALLNVNRPEDLAGTGIEVAG